MPTLVACLWRRVEAIQLGRVPTHFGPATRLRRPESQWNQGALATSQVEMCPRTANSGLAAGDGIALIFTFPGLHGLAMDFSLELLRRIHAYNSAHHCEEFLRHCWCDC